MRQTKIWGNKANRFEKIHNFIVADARTLKLIAIFRTKEIHKK